MNNFIAKTLVLLSLCNIPQFANAGEEKPTFFTRNLKISMGIGALVCGSAIIGGSLRGPIATPQEKPNTKSPDMGEKNRFSVIEFSDENLPETMEQFHENVSFGPDASSQAFPIVFRGAGKNWKTQAWSFTNFAKELGDEPIKIIVDWGKPRQGSAQSRQVETTVAEFIKDIKENPISNTYFPSATLARSETANKEALSKFLDIDFLDRHLDLLEGTKFPEFEDSNILPILFLGSDRIVTPLHNHQSVLNLQVKGKKHWYFAHPEAIDHIYCREEQKRKDTCTSDVDFRNLDYLTYPDLDSVKVYDVVLNEGDVLYLPNKWFHQVVSLEEGISLAWFQEKVSQ